MCCWVQHYKTDAAVAADGEVVALVEELYDPDMGGLPGRRLVADTIDSLTDFVTSVMFTASAGHSVVNFGQFDFYAFIPNRPLFLSKLLPQDTSLVTYEYIMRALPDPDVAEETIVLGRTLTYLEHHGLLSAYRLGDDVPSTSLPEASPTEVTSPNKDPTDIHSAASFSPIYRLNPTAYQKYVKTLEQIDQDIKTENQLQNLYYPYFEPTVCVCVCCVLCVERCAAGV